MIRIIAVALAFFAAAAAPAYAQRAVIRGLDKVTGHASDYTLTVGRAARIGSLEVIARSCHESAPEETPEVRIYVEVFDHPPVRGGGEAERREIFHGWLFASSPGLSAVDHPAYDIWAIDCR
ncbi:MAG TPA: DUF2155 domain-containing protein [Vitreimonas sp.]|uniref:DUF2155 domain-containing protein n=1 Tax=Vitreimonas sp. TaxID=3069702 RepID=UPI002D559B70|nr:DUF2155 domain-containing protein [Vitreimonas sp.]HYD88385.1 DUF2155 domain-containing protein [Vitreimonas sp.]